MSAPHHIPTVTLLTPISRLSEPPTVRLPMVGDPEVCNLTYDHATQKLYWRQRPPAFTLDEWVDWPAHENLLAATG